MSDGPTAAAEPVTVTVVRSVAPGRAADLEHCRAPAYAPPRRP